MASSRIRMGGFFQDSTGNTDALALATGEFAPPVADDGLIPVGLGHDKVVGVGNSGRFHDIRFGSRTTEGNVVKNGVV